MSMTTTDTDPFDDLSFGDHLRYIGPDDFGGEWAAPSDRNAPFEFRHISTGGTLTLETRFRGRRYLAPEHPANERGYWEVVGDE